MDLFSKPEILEKMLEYGVSKEDPLFIFLETENEIIENLQKTISKTYKTTEAMIEKTAEAVTNINNQIMENLRRTEEMNKEAVETSKNIETRTASLKGEIEETTRPIKERLENIINEIDTTVFKETIIKTLAEATGKIPIQELMKTSNSIAGITKNLAETATTYHAITEKLEQKTTRLTKILNKHVAVSAVIVSLVSGIAAGIYTGYQLTNNTRVQMINNITQNKEVLNNLAQDGIKIEYGLGNELRIITTRKYTAYKEGNIPVIKFK